MPSEIRRIMISGKGLPRKRMVACFLHIMLWPLLLIPRMFWPLRRARPLADGGRVLFVRIDGIGDLVMTSAVFPALRARFPGVKIDLLTSNQAMPIARLLQAAGWIDRLWEMPLVGRRFSDYRAMARQLRREKFDAAIDMRGDLRNILLMWMVGIPRRLGLPASGLTYLLTDVIDLPDPHHQADESAALVKRLGVDDVAKYPHLPLRADDLAAADRWLNDHGVTCNRPLCAFHLSAYLESKIWPLERFIAVAQRLRDSFNAQFLVVGGPNETLAAQGFAATVGGPVAVAAGEAPLILTAALLSRCSVFIGNDSGPAHMAAYGGCPVVVLFGRGDAPAYRPLAPDVALLQSPVPCDPKCAKTCVRGERFCMLDITVDAVVNAAEEFVGGRRRAPTAVPSAPPSAPN